MPSREIVIRKVTDEYAFLKDLDSDLLRIVKDSKAHKEKKLGAKIVGAKKAI